MAEFNGFVLVERTTSNSNTKSHLPIHHSCRRGTMTTPFKLSLPTDTPWVHILLFAFCL